VPLSSFSGSRVSLVDVLFTLAAGAPAGLRDVLWIGSADDPVYISSRTSNGDDISVQQEAAQARSAWTSRLAIALVFVALCMHSCYAPTCSFER
jgi:hypothetical protein